MTERVCVEIQLQENKLQDSIMCDCLVFFFQAEDGIRDLTVTGVQTCALPICPTIQQTFSEGAEPAVRSANTLLVCRSQEAPSSAENSIMPAWPARQRDFLAGAAITAGLMAPAIRKATPSLKAAAGGGAACGAAAATR